MWKCGNANMNFKIEQFENLKMWKRNARLYSKVDVEDTKVRHIL